MGCLRAGRNKLVINHLGRLFVTSDAATIIREIEVVHPAAKLLVMASQAQESEVCLCSFSCGTARDVGGGIFKRRVAWSARRTRTERRVYV